MGFHDRWRQASAVLLSCSLLASGCATAGGGRLDPPATAAAAGHAAIADFVQKLPLGTSVQIDRVQGRSIRGILLKASAETVTVQPRTRLPEPPIDVRMADIVRVQPEAAGNGRSLGKAIGIGAAAGGGAALGVFLVLIAIFSD